MYFLYTKIVHLITKQLIMGLSTDTLLHQTKFEHLQNIIDEGHFKVNYSKEEFNSTVNAMGSGYIHVFPMVSFSEIPISSLHNHLKRYGDCIVGIKKSWAQRNGLNQVLYYQKESMLAESLFDSYHKYSQLVVNQINPTPDEMEIYRHLEYQLAHSKNYRGRIQTETFMISDYLFAEEKEWRFVPQRNVEDPPLSIILSEYEERKEHYKEIANRFHLEFELADIDFLILGDENEKEIMREKIKSLDDTIQINLFTNEEIRLSFFGYQNISMDPD